MLGISKPVMYDLMPKNKSGLLIALKTIALRHHYGFGFGISPCEYLTVNTIIWNFLIYYSEPCITANLLKGLID